MKVVINHYIQFRWIPVVRVLPSWTVLTKYYSLSIRFGYWLIVQCIAGTTRQRKVGDFK